MQLGKALEDLLAFRGEIDEHHPSIFLPRPPFDESSLLAPRHEGHRAVMMRLQALGELAYGRALATGKSLHMQQQLILQRRDPVLTGDLLAVSQVPAQLVPEGRQLFVLAFGDPRAAFRWHR